MKSVFSRNKRVNFSIYRDTQKLYLNKLNNMLFESSACVYMLLKVQPTLYAHIELH